MNIRTPDYTAVLFDGGQAMLNESLIHEDIRIVYTTENGGLAVSLTADTTPVRFLRLRWNYRPEEKPSGALRVLGDEWERGYGEMQWGSIVPEENHPWYCFITNGSDSTPENPCKTYAFGVMVRPRAFCFWQLDVAGVTLWMDVRNGGEGVLLNGRTLNCATVLFREYDSETFSDEEKKLAGPVFLACEAFCREMCPDPIFPKEPVYGSNNWYYAYGNSSHEEILRDASFVAEMTHGLDNRPYMVIDDGWQPANCDGPWDRGNQKFPDMARLAGEIAAMDVKPGIWYRPLADIARRTPGITEEMRLSRNADYLDPTHPAVKELLYRDMKRLVEWGYTLIKHDYSTCDLFGDWGISLKASITRQNGWHFYDRSLTSAEVVLDFYTLLREAAGKDAMILGCNTISHLCAGLVELNRTGDDTSGREWDRTRNRGVNTLAFRMPQNHTFYESDADCVGITEAVPWELNRQWLKALANSGSPLFVSCKLGILDDRQLAELKEAFAVASVQKDRLVPLNWTETVTPDRWLLNGEEISFDWVPNDGCHTNNF